jgi:hypothetical protein
MLYPPFVQASQASSQRAYPQAAIAIVKNPKPGYVSHRCGQTVGFSKLRLYHAVDLPGHENKKSAVDILT